MTLLKKDFYFIFSVKMSYYWFNREEMLQKYHNYGGKEKVAEYYQENRDILKEKATNKYKKVIRRRKRSKKTI